MGVSDIVADCGFAIFSGAVAAGGVVKAIRVPEGKRVSNARLKPKARPQPAHALLALP